MRMNFDNIADVGIIKDSSELDIPMNAWTDGDNVRFIDGKIQTIRGYNSVFGTPSVVPYYVTPVQKASNLFYFYASLTKIYGTDGTNHNEMLSATAAATAQINWNGGILGGGVAIFNNGVDAPFSWVGDTLSDYFTSLANWPSGMVARVVRPYKQYLVAADIDENDGNGRNGNLLRWSHPAVVGAVPSSWDWTDLTLDAGRKSIADGGDFIVDMLQLFDTNYIYKENSIFSMNYIGGNNTFAFRRVFDQLGILSRRCVKAFKGMHFLVGSGDVVLHDGRGIQYPLHRKMVDWLYSQMDQDNADRTFVTVDYNNNEILICYPEAGESLPNRAIVWNWKDGTTSVRAIPRGTAHIAWGLVDPGNNAAINAISGTYEDATFTFDKQVYSSAVRSLLMCDTVNTLFHRSDETINTFNGATASCYIRRSGLPLGRQGPNGVHYDPMQYKSIRAVWPVIEGTDGDQVEISIGVRDYQSDAISWETRVFTIGQDYAAYFRKSGRLIDIEFRSNADIRWDLVSYAVDYELGGIR